MYTPEKFKEDNIDILHDLIEAYNFGIMASISDVGQIASHLPFMVDRTRGQYGTLIAHMARPNPQWKTFASGLDVLVIFQGPHSYISPAWYQDQETVPTWNYAAVHCTGTPEIISDDVQLLTMVNDLVLRHEAAVGNPWDQFKGKKVTQSLLRGIVGFEIPVRQIEGAFKFNQNRSLEDQKGVAQALRDHAHPDIRGVAKIMVGNVERHDETTGGA